MKAVGVIGTGKFGMAIAKLLSPNVDVLMYSRRKEIVQAINNGKRIGHTRPATNVKATDNPQFLSEQCDLIFPVVPSINFRNMIREFAPFLTPKHILIQCTKGLDIGNIDFDAVIAKQEQLTPNDVKTMSEVIEEETSVVRIGCLSGPNLSSEIMMGEPTATVIASRFDEVIELGRKVLEGDMFSVYGTNDIKGAEWGGVLKNCYAIAAGMIQGYGLGHNFRAVIITRGIYEMMKLSHEMGSSKQAFFGMSGVGDMIATAAGNKSRNFAVGERMGKGEKLSEILATMTEPAEGLRTIAIARELSRYFKLKLPIIDGLYRIIYEDFDKQKAIVYVMNQPYKENF